MAASATSSAAAKLGFFTLIVLLLCIWMMIAAVAGGCTAYGAILTVPAMPPSPASSIVAIKWVAIGSGGSSHPGKSSLEVNACSLDVKARIQRCEITEEYVDDDMPLVQAALARGAMSWRKVSGAPAVPTAKPPAMVE